MNLVSAEFRRLFARRLTRIAVALVLVILAAVLAFTAYGSRPATTSERAAAVHSVSEQAAPAAANRKACVAAKAAGGTRAQAYRTIDCDQLTAPTVAEYLRPPYVFASRAADLVGIVTALLGISLLVIGASFIGAEWNHGTVAALLTWEPRRLRVFVGKLLGLLAGGAVICVLVYGVAIGASYLIATWFGSPLGLTPGAGRELALSAVRGSSIALIAGAAGFAVASVARMSAAAMGLALAYVLGVEVGLRLADDRTERWLLSTNITAWVDNGTTVSTLRCGGPGACMEVFSPVSMWQGGIYLAAIALVMLVIAAVVFLRRDV